MENFCIMFLGALIGNLVGDFLYRKFGGDDR